MSDNDRHQGGSRLTSWHQDLFAAVGRWRWLQTLDGGVAGVLQPLYDRHRDDLAVELAAHTRRPRANAAAACSSRGTRSVIMFSLSGAPEARVRA